MIFMNKSMTQVLKHRKANLYKMKANKEFITNGSSYYERQRLNKQALIVGISSCMAATNIFPFMQVSSIYKVI